MIFATVGHATQPFPRLIGALEAYATSARAFCEPVLMQYGSSAPAASLFCVRELRQPLFLRLLTDADVIVTHAGAGTLIECWETRKVPVVMPRQARYREHVDDHQVELAVELAKEGLLLIATVDTLADKIEEARGRCLQTVPRSSLPPLIAQALKDYV